MERAAWFCPSCQKYHAPHVETCPSGSTDKPDINIERGCRVCGVGANGETMGYVCPRGDCPTRISCVAKLPSNPNQWIQNSLATTGGAQ